MIKFQIGELYSYDFLNQKRTEIFLCLDKIMDWMTGEEYIKLLHVKSNKIINLNRKDIGQRFKSLKDTDDEKTG